MIKPGMRTNKWDVCVIWVIEVPVVSTENVNLVLIRWEVMGMNPEGIVRVVGYVITRVVSVDVLKDLEEKNAASLYSIPSFRCNFLVD